MSKLTELAERCEQATGADYALGREILFACGWTEQEWEEIGEEPGFVMVAPDGTVPQEYPQPTHSLDAAMTLVPDGLKILVDEHARSWVVTLWSNTVTPVAESEAATEPLARAAAALKARARIQNTPDSQRGG